MCFSLQKLSRNLFLKSLILILGSISFGKPVIAIPVELTCFINDSYGVIGKIFMDKNGKKRYPYKFTNNKSEKYEQFKVIFDINKGEGTLMGSTAKIISSRLDLSKDKGIIINPILLYSSNAYYENDSDEYANIRKMNKFKRFFILDKGQSSSSEFTLIDTSVKSKIVDQIKVKTWSDKNTSQKIYYGYCKQLKS